MSQSLSNLLIHIVFSTKQRESLIDETIEVELHKYIVALLKDCSCQPIIINGTENHIHILCNLAKTKSVSSVIEDIKKKSSKWIKRKGVNYERFYWQNGYGAFSIGKSQAKDLIKYIKCQKDHHTKRTFQDELLDLLKRYDVDYDERYLWD